MDQIDRLDRLVDSILESVRVVPDQPAELAHVDLQDTIGELVEELRPLLHRHRPAIVRSRRLHVLADRDRLRQVLEHLLENAVKYAPPDTRVEIEWALVEGVVRIAVTDEGPGIPAGVARADLRAVRPARDADGAGVRHRALRGTAPGGVHGRATVVRAGTRRRRAVRARPARRGRRLRPRGPARKEGAFA